MYLRKGLLAILGLSLSLSTVSFAQETQPEAQDGQEVMSYEGDTTADLNEAFPLSDEALTDEDALRHRYPNPPRYPRRFVCYAQNLRRQVFTGYGSSRASARRRALRSCQYRSLHC